MATFFIKISSLFNPLMGGIDYNYLGTTTLRVFSRDIKIKKVPIFIETYIKIYHL